MRLYRPHDEFAGSLRAAAMQYLEAVAACLVIVFKKHLQLLEPFTAEIVDVSEAGSGDGGYPE
jgi:hypothetical protein